MTNFQSIILLAVALVQLTSSASVPQACTSLQKKFPTSVFQPQSGDYNTQVAHVWSETCLTHPYCVFEPASAQDLAAGLKIIVSSNTKFAVRSGGHMPVPGANGIDNGVLISMSGLNQKKMINNNEIVQLGPGQTWNDVYQYTSPFNKGVAGGRFSPVGVGGLLLGGGLPYFASQTGWSANTVKTYQVVLADGSVVDASQQDNSDLWWALKGGSNNFGIVTRYDMQTLPVTKLYGGSTVYNATNFQAFLDAITAYVSPGGGSEDVKAAILPNINVTPKIGVVQGSLVSFYDGGNNNPKALQGFAKVPNSFSDNAVRDNFLAYTNLTNLAIYGARNERWLFGSTAVKVTESTMKLLNDQYTQFAIETLKDVNGSQSSLGMQPITKAQLQAARKAGGDAIDLDPSFGTFISVLITASWDNAADDAMVNNFATTFLSNLDAAAKKQGLYIPFTFLNDGHTGQQVFQQYGNGKSLPKLQQIAKKYDPNSVFQKLETGGFKLSAAGGY